MIDGCFNCVTSHIKVLRLADEEERKKERKKRKKMNNSEFGPFQVGHLRVVSSTTVDLGSTHKLL